jgi:hypothetical protein
LVFRVKGMWLVERLCVCIVGMRVGHAGLSTTGVVVGTYGGRVGLTTSLTTGDSLQLSTGYPGRAAVWCCGLHWELAKAICCLCDHRRVTEGPAGARRHMAPCSVWMAQRLCATGCVYGGRAGWQQLCCSCCGVEWGRLLCEPSWGGGSRVVCLENHRVASVLPRLGRRGAARVCHGISTLQGHRLGAKRVLLLETASIIMSPILTLRRTWPRNPLALASCLLQRAGRATQ